MADNLDLLLVFPNNRIRAYGSLASEVVGISPPVQSGMTAAYVRERGHSVRILDADALAWLPDQVGREVAAIRPRLVMLSTDHVNSGDVTKMAAATETVKAIHAAAPGVPVLLDGVVPTAYPRWMLEDEGADYVCQGEPYEPIVKLLEKLKEAPDARLSKGEIVGIWARYGDDIVESVRAPLFHEVDKLPMTAWDLMPPSNYRAHHWHCFDRLDQRSPYASVFTNLGCPYGCSFCSVNVVAGGPNFRTHSPEYVMKELTLLNKKYGVTNIRLLDNVFTIRLDLVEELCDRIIAADLNLNFWAYARVESVRNPDILKKMRKAGVRWLAYGIEAAHERVRAAVGKPSNPEIIEQAVEWTKEAGIWIVGNFIFGLPEDDRESMQMSLDMAKRFNFEWANFYCAMAYPGTKLYDEVGAQGIELPKDWGAYGQYSANSQPLATKYLTSKEIVKFRDAAFLEYFENPRYLNMLENTFGSDARDFVRRILTHQMKREG
jgi:anaerobic magnesium-protoporphyrin IX monomethyl ester cyclase